MKLTIETVAFFKAAGVFRVKSDEKARERFDEALPDYDDGNSLTDEEADELFAALIAHRDEMKAEKVKAEIERLERKAAREAAAEEKAAKLRAMPVSGGADGALDHIVRMPAGRYVLTSAQNNTDVDATAFAALQVFCEDMGAKLLIGRLTYNKNGFQQPGVDCEDLWYAPQVKPYLVDGQIDLDGFFHFIADANVIPTARNPISGFEGITPAGIGAVIPATKIGLKVSAALKGAAVKILTSTGSVTKRNYILRKAGAVAAIEHNIGAVFIDTEDKVIRHLEQMDGTDGFYDLGELYTSKGSKYGKVTAIQFGDIHAEKMEEKNLANAIDMIETYQPDHVILHDVLDFSSRNHHNIKDPFFIHEQMIKGNSVRGDLQKLARVIDSLAEVTSGAIEIIESNHDLAINTWLKTVDPKTDPVNAVVYHKCMLARLEHVEEQNDDYFNMLRFGYETIGGGEFADKINFHETDESVMIAGVEMGCHGHNGANGSRGSPVGFRSLGVAMNTGHTHSPGINGRVYTAGVLGSLDMGYNIGASSWAIAHIFTYPNGQRQVIFG